MSLSAEEFRVHLEMTAATAGVPLPEIVLPDGHHLLLGRMRFHYLDWGTAGLPPVVFLHGGGLNAHTWDLVCAALRRGPARPAARPPRPRPGQEVPAEGHRAP